jgi:hypothetical protein
MTNSREQLIHMLTEAAEIEHNLLCSYLYAVFSLKRAGEPGLTSDQADAVERWRKVILSIALEEMAHLACVNNLLISIGGAPHFDRANFPIAPGYHPADVVVRLTPFDQATLDHFIFLERPEGSSIGDGQGFEASGVDRKVPIEGVTPSAEDYATVGALYDSIATAFESLAERVGEAGLFDPTGTCQLDTEVVQLPNIFPVTDLRSALRTIEHIKEEGEGSSGETEDSHFARFQAIKEEWSALRNADPDFKPAWPAAHNPVMRKPSDEKQRVWVTHPLSAAYLDLANASYGAMLSVLAQTFNLSSADQQRLYMRVSIELMEASAALSAALARLPSGSVDGVNAGMTFAVPRNSAFRPLTSRAQSLFLERVLEIEEAAMGVLTGEAAGKVLRRLRNVAELLDGKDTG